MLAITDEELDLARTEYLDIMRDTFTITRKERQDDGTGNIQDVNVTYGPYPCRVVDMRVNRPIEFAQGQQITAVMVMEFVTPHGIDIHTDDILNCNGILYEVVDDNDNRTDSLVQLVNVVKLN